MSKERAHFFVSGRVQGVGFRHATRVAAMKLGLVGWVRNTEDEAVEVVAEGTSEQLEALLAWCRRGPPLAEVTGVRIHSRGPASNEFGSFEVRR